MKTRRKSRIEELIGFDKDHGSSVIGTDEAGRGPLAGPVVASAVFFPEFTDEVIETIKFIDDSKKFSSNPALRKEIAEQIKKVALYKISECSVEEIEKYNILQASLLAMKRACDDIFLQIDKIFDETDKKIDKSVKNSIQKEKNFENFLQKNKQTGNLSKKINKIVILIDGKFTISNYKVNQKAVKKGDSVSASIAAASILAKVHRDQIMENLSQEFPVYSWHKNKGYATPEHIKAIRSHGHCKWHRKSFLSKIFAEQKNLFSY